MQWLRSIRRTLQDNSLRDWRFARGLDRCGRCGLQSYDMKHDECRSCDFSDEQACARMDEDFFSAPPPPMAP